MFKALRSILPALIVIALVMVFVAPYFTEMITYQKPDSEVSKFEARQELEKLQGFGGACVLMLPVVFICWIVYAIRGRKNLYRRSIAKLLGHLCLGLLAAVMSFSTENDTALFMKVFWACFPYGLMIVGTVMLNLWPTMDDVDWEKQAELRSLEWDFGDRDRLTERSAASLMGILFLGLLCGIVGIVCCPVILILDVVSIVRLRRLA